MNKNVHSWLLSFILWHSYTFIHFFTCCHPFLLLNTEESLDLNMKIEEITPLLMASLSGERSILQIMSLCWQTN